MSGTHIQTYKILEGFTACSFSHVSTRSQHVQWDTICDTCQFAMEQVSSSAHTC